MSIFPLHNVGLFRRAVSSHSVVENHRATNDEWTASVGKGRRNHQIVLCAMLLLKTILSVATVLVVSLTFYYSCYKIIPQQRPKLAVDASILAVPRMVAQLMRHDDFFWHEIDAIRHIMAGAC